MCVPCRYKTRVMFDRVRLANDKLNAICDMPPHDKKQLITKNYMNTLFSSVSQQHLMQPKINSKLSPEDLEREIDKLNSTVEKKVPDTLISISKKIIRANNKENPGLRPGRGKRSSMNQQEEAKREALGERSQNLHKEP